MGCCDGTILSDEERFKVYSNTPCGAITVDMLIMYRRPIECYLQYGLWGKIGSTEEELTLAVEYLTNFINQKNIDDENCEGLDKLPIIRLIIDKIFKAGICL